MYSIWPTITCGVQPIGNSVCYPSQRSPVFTNTGGTKAWWHQVGNQNQEPEIVCTQQPDLGMRKQWEGVVSWWMEQCLTLIIQIWHCSIEPRAIGGTGGHTKNLDQGSCDSRRLAPLRFYKPNDEYSRLETQRSNSESRTARQA